MTAAEIRHIAEATIKAVEEKSHGDIDAIRGGLIALIAYTTAEIAAQLAEMNERQSKKSGVIC